MCVVQQSTPWAPAIFHQEKKKNQSDVQEGLIFIITSLTFSRAKFALQLSSDTAAG